MADVKMGKGWLQIRTGRIQRTVVAGSGCQHQGSTILLASTRSGAYAALPRSGCPRLTHTLSPCSAVRAPLSCTYYRIDTRGFTRATGFIRPTYSNVLTTYIRDYKA